MNVMKTSIINTYRFCAVEFTFVAFHPISVQLPQPIPTITNRYKVLDNLHSNPLTHQQRKHANNVCMAKKESIRVTNSVRTAQQTTRRENDNKKALAKKRSKIIIIGDSHARGCAQEI